MLSRRDLVTALAAGGLAATASPAFSRSGMGSVTIPIKITQNTPWISVRIGEGRVAPFVLATPVSQLHCDPAVVKRVLGREASSPTAAHIARRVVLGGSVRLQDELTLFERPRAFAERPVVGALGMRLFRRYDVDWDAERLTLHERASRAEMMDEISTTKGSKFNPMPWPTVFADIDGRRLRLLVYSSAPQGLVLVDTVENHAFARSYARRRDDLGRNGAPSGQTFVSSVFRIGDVEVPSPIVAVGGLLKGTQGPADGVIGFDMLRRFNLSVSQAIEEVRVTANRQARDVHLDNRAGLNLYARSGVYEVGEIDPTGSAHAAGLRNGDAIVEHHGPGGLRALAWTLTREAGRRAPVTVQRGAKTWDAEIVLRDRV